MPIMAAMVVGTTFAPVVKFGFNRGLSPWLSAVALVLLLLAVLGVAATMLTAPVTEWIGRAPEIGAILQEKLYLLDRPLSALRNLQEALLPSSGNEVRISAW
jgi:predicted PurR-regulated permease PerM